MLVVILLVGAALLLLNSRPIQSRAMAEVRMLLTEKLDTQIEIDSVSIDFFKQAILVTGLKVDDRQGRKMLELERLSADFGIWNLLKHKISIESAEIRGLKAQLYKEPDSAANYQFVIDAFSKNKTHKTKKDKGKHKLELDISDLYITDIDLSYNANSFTLDKLTYHEDWMGARTGGLKNLHGKMDQNTKKGIVTHEVNIGKIILSEENHTPVARFDSLHYRNDNHRPRKNTGKPKRGFFDTGHFDVMAHFNVVFNHLGKDSLNVTLNQCTAQDSITGFNIKDLRLTAAINKGNARLSNVVIQQQNTVLKFDSATVRLPNKKTGKTLAYQTSQIEGRTLLKDIARPFAPVLSRFAIPLNLRVELSGTDSTMQFRNIHVNSDNKYLVIDAAGGISHLKSKEKLNIGFHVNKMTTTGTTAQNIINQFAVKKFMMKQLKSLGTIQYIGDITIVWRREAFKGTLQTSVGKLGFEFALNENTKYIEGNASTASIQLGKLVDMKSLGPVAFHADFVFDISKPRTAKIRREKGGKLPIGHVNANVTEASYKLLKVKNLEAVIKSDGLVADGHIIEQKKNLDLICDFTFTNTDSIHKLKFKPNVKLRNMPWHKKDKAGKPDKNEKSEKKEPSENKVTTEKKEKKGFLKWFKKKKGVDKE